MEELLPRQLNRLTLAKQGLLERRTGTAAVWAGRLCGLHAQVPTTPALSLLARLRDFDKTDLEVALRRRRLVKRWLMRGTLHIIPTVDLPMFHQALRRAWHSSLGRFLERQGLPSRDVRVGEIYPLVVRILREGPLPRADITQRLQPLLSPELAGRDGITGWGGSLKEMAYDGLLVHALGTGPEAPLASLEQWLPKMNLGAMGEAEALEGLAARYFAAYGPATSQDLATWSGIPASALRPALQALRWELLEVSLMGQDSRYLTPRSDARVLSRVEDAEAPPRFLPRFDDLFLAYRDRGRVLEAPFKGKVILPAGQMEATFLVDGHVAGIWGMARRGKRLAITLEPFRTLHRDNLAALREEAQGLAAFYGAKGGDVRVG